MPSPFEFLVVLLAMSKALVLVGGAAGCVYLLGWSAATTAHRRRGAASHSPRGAKRRSKPVSRVSPSTGRSLNQRRS